MLTERDREVFKWIEEYRAITVNQAKELFFNGQYESCRRRLKQLEIRKELRSYKSQLLNQKVYYQKKKVSEHDLLVLDFIRVIKSLGGEIRKFKTQPAYLKGLIRPDAYLEIIFKKYVYFILLEIDYTHYTNKDKMQIYEHLYRQGSLQEMCYGTFPIVVIARQNDKISKKYYSNNFDIIYTDLNFLNIEKIF